MKKKITKKRLVRYVNYLKYGIAALLIIGAIIRFTYGYLAKNANINNIGTTTNGVVAFPGAEGFGAETKGGRGGKVIEVTNLNDSGPGSLRQCAAVESGARTCVFRVGGTITLNSDIDIVNPYLTIAGQTAPGDGITIKAANPAGTAHIQIRAPEVIIRYLRSRPGTKEFNARALSVNNPQNTVNNVMIDHNSFSWAGDELTITWLATNHVSYQWNIAAESLPPGNKGPSFGEDGGGYFSVHHNLIAHHTQRLPQVSASGGPVDIVNNVVYNLGGLGSTVKNGTHANYVGNYIKAGPNTTTRAYIRDGGDKGPADGYYVENNYLDGISQLNTAVNQVSTRYEAPAVTTTSPQTAYEDVLNKAGAYQGINCNGAWVARRDSVDSRIIESVRARTRGHNGTGFLTDPSLVGGWPNLATGVACTDSDHDGMPDIWETANFGNLSRGSSSDSSSDADGDGYTDLEEYFNGTSPSSITVSSAPLPITTPTPSPTSTSTLVPSPSPSRTPSPTPTATATPSPSTVVILTPSTSPIASADDAIPKRSNEPKASKTPKPNQLSTVELIEKTDANNDGRTNRADLRIWYRHVGQKTTRGVQAGDFDQNGRVNLRDLGLWFRATL